MFTNPHKAGFVNIVGQPNVGKSTLINALVGKKLSIITAKAQTTRHRIAGIVSGDHFQIIYTDTPGAITPHYPLQQSMMRAAYSALTDADILLWVVDVNDQTCHPDLSKRLENITCPICLIINKIDTVNESKLSECVQYWNQRTCAQKIIPISALKGFGIDVVFDYILTQLPEHPPYYPKDMITDKPERFFVSEIIRGSILKNYRQEIPYSVEVVTETFKEEADLIKICTIINVEKQSQKGILIGSKGSALKKIGTEARQELEQFFGKRIFLKQYVKVAPEWRTQPRLLQKFGYT